MNSNQKLLAGLVVATAALPALSGTAYAAYSADSDTGIQALDYIENNRIDERQRRLTEEQKKLLEDAANMEKHLRQPLAKDKPMPVAFEGEDLTYDQRDGSFIAKGKVDILQMDAHRFQGEEVTGNTERQEIDIPGKAHILQMTPGQMRITLDGYKAHYNYGTKTGTIDNVRGKADAHYITGKRFEFYPDHIVVYDGTQTKCGAKSPDYHLQAKKITMYPNDKIVLEDVSFWLKKIKLYSRKRYVVDISPGADKAKYPYPRVGYNTDDKLTFSWDLSFPVASNVAVNTNIYVTGADGWRGNYDVTWKNKKMAAGVTYGYFEDSDNRWIRKQPAVFWRYGDHIGDSHFTYKLYTEYGRWYGKGIHSNHSYYSATLGYDPIKFSRYTLYLSLGYNITRESYDNSRVAGIKADAVLTKDFDERWAAYAGYHYSRKDAASSLFNFGTDDYRRKLEGGFSYRVDEKNRLAVGTKYDLDHGKWKNIDYYWYHDMHCAESIVRYKSLHNQISIRFQFTPW